MNTQHHTSFRLAAMAAAVLAAYSPAHADDINDIEWLTNPGSTISVGAGYLREDAPRFGQYTGVNDTGVYGILNFDINRLEKETGTWLRLKGNNLGFENRDLRLQHERQGDWGYFIDYSEMPRFEPYTAYTAVTGIGTPFLAIPNSAAAVEVPVNLKMKREALGLGFSKQLGNGFDLQVRVRNEEKNGERIFARGTATPAWEFAPEPLNSTTRQLEAILGYADKKFQVSGIYYGTSYNNHNTALNFSGGNAALSTFSPVGLPPDSQSHQLALDGGYSFTESTRGNFKLAYTHATQNDTFIAGVPVNAGINPVGNLGGRVDTTLMQVGLSSRPLPRLSLSADLRHENRSDKTPVRLYTIAGVSPTSTFSGENEPRSFRSTTGKLEASYRLPDAMRVTGGVEYVEKERNTSAIRVVSFRDKTEESSYRVGLQRTMSDTVTGSVTYIRSERTGSDFRINVLNCGAVTCGTSSALNLIAPLHLADRQRDKLRVNLNWTPVEALSIQLLSEQTWDDYGQRTADEFGLRDGTSRNHSIDLSYAFSDEWQANGWVSKNDTEANRANRISATQPWASTLLNNGKAIGAGLRGKPLEKVEIGADLSHSEITDKFRQWAIAGAAVPSLPSFFTRQTSLKLFGTYALQKNASLRLDYVFDRYRTNDWSWATWTYTDGTYLSQRMHQTVSFVGVTYIYRFQ